MKHFRCNTCNMDIDHVNISVKVREITWNTDTISDVRLDKCPVELQGTCPECGAEIDISTRRIPMAVLKEAQGLFNKIKKVAQ